MEFKPSILTKSLIGGVVALAFCGCASNDSSPTTATNTSSGSSSRVSNVPAHLTIAVIPKGSTHDYWKCVHEGATQAEKELGNVTVDWRGPEKEDDRDYQIQLVENSTNQDVNGIVLAPLDDQALAKPVENAAKANIPVAIIDSGLNGTGYISFIATDNYKGGRMAGEELAKELGGKGKVIMLRYEVGSASTDAREKGFMDVMAQNKGIEVVSSNQYGGATAESAQKAAENLLATHKKGGGLDIDGIYTPNESTAFGMLLCLKDYGVAGKVKFVGFDASPKLIDGLKAGEINALVVQDPRKMGYLGVKTVVDYIEKKPIKDKIDTGATLVTQANMTDPKIAELIAPPKG